MKAARRPLPSALIRALRHPSVWCSLVAACQASAPGAKAPAPTEDSGNASTISRVEAEQQTAPPKTTTLFLRSPQPGSSHDPLLAPLLELCGPGDLTLHRAAEQLLLPKLAQRRLDSASVTFAVRSAGSGLVRARGLRLQGANTELTDFEQPITAWLRSLGPSSTRRCGVAQAPLGKTSTTLLGMVVAEALAELDPLPSRVLPGTRIELQARLLEPSTHVELVLLGPRGAPRRVATELAGDRVSAVFYLDAVGTHLAQLMLDREGGPEPALEAWIGVGKALPEAPLTEFVPGEGATIGSSSPEARITAMLNAARRSEGISELRRHPELDRLARAHAQAMRRAGRLAHDLGNGNPIFRVQAASLAATTTGENLARASSLTRAHRAIWASPSHRANLLAAHFDSLGVGLARDAQGDWWLCQLLVDQR